MNYSTKTYIKSIFLPLLLAILFAAQNEFFNLWLDIYSKTYSTRLFLAAFALGIILYGPALLFNRSFKFIYLFIISFLVSFIFSAQFLYYRYSQSFLQFSAIKYFGQTQGVAGTVGILVTPELLLFAANFVIVAVSFILSYRFLSKKRENNAEAILPNWEKLILILAMALIVFFGYKYLLDTEKKEWGSTSRLYTDVYDLKALVGKMGIMNFFLEDTFKYILRSNLVADADINFLKTFARNRTQLSQDKKGKYFGTATGKNIIIIQVESLENAVINKTINGQAITPNLNQLASEGIYFNNFYSQTGPGNTADAEFTTMTSLYPLPDDVVFINYAKNQYKALPQLLKNNGYGTYSFHGDVPTFWNRSNIYPGLGYQKAYNLDDFVVTRSVGKGPSDLGDEDLFFQSLPRLESLKKPFLATVITMSSHTPFILPADLQTLKIPAETNLTFEQQQYLQSIHYADKAIGEFIDGLKNAGLYDNSMIFIWGDHGSYTNISSALGQDKNTISELAGSQVPLIILGAGENGIIGAPGSQLDVYPTITNFLGIQTPKTVLGQDLFNPETSKETHFRVISGGIDAILTENLAYRANNDGVFDHGFCELWPSKEILPISDCKDIYKKQSEEVKASNIIIRGNLLNLLNN